MTETKFYTDAATKVLSLPAKGSITGVAYDWTTGRLKTYPHPLSPNEVHFLNDAGQSYDHTTADCWETVQNFATDSECATVLIVGHYRGQLDDEAWKAYNVAVRERELHADCFGPRATVCTRCGNSGNTHDFLATHTCA